MGKRWKSSNKSGFLLVETMVCLALFITTVLLVGYAMAHMYTMVNECTMHAKAFDAALVTSSHYLVHGQLSEKPLEGSFIVTTQTVTVAQRPEVVQSRHEIVLEPLEFLKVSADNTSVYALALKSVQA